MDFDKQRNVEGFHPTRTPPNATCLEQGGEESLADYYGRARELLRRSHGRDVIINGSSPLSPIEQVVSPGIISAFLGGIKEDDVRKAAMMKSMTTTRSLRAAYEAAEDTKAATTKISEMEKARAEKKELEILRRQNNQRWGQTVNSGVTSPYQSSVNHERKMNMTHTQSTRQLTTDLTHSMVGTNSGQSNRSVVPPNRLSRHPIINGTKPYSKEMGLLCFRCGELGHRKAECTGNPLEWWEQMKLKEILWPKTSSNYARVSDTGAGLRYRDIEDSDWRSRDLPERIKEEAEITQEQVPFYNSDTPELTFEQKAVEALGDHELKAFRVPVTVRTRKGRQDVNVTLPASMAQADQGSDMIIVTIGFLKKLGLPMKSLSEKGFNGLTMNVADGTSSKLSYFSEFEIGVMGIWRKVEAFVRPFSSEYDEEVHLLLGMPWLHAVDAKIRIRDSIIEIGDEAQTEAIVKLQGPKFVESEIRKLILCPKEKIDARVNKTDYVESSSEDGDDESFWESEEDSDDIDLSSQENCST
ncbi:hypothetical protein OnM2_063021 [Erysiphe neolycopersici]|uniref:CCHC-type domain-containing protein n=1 Tax=Erysiphe neolycopersici TaxID=212602 RepID=A0A420HNR1_9PEZI|nr:hypothetical protein OnM2_063021 [Erysiphe neolycopersici]